MNDRYRLYRRTNKIYYVEDTRTGKQTSLSTKNLKVAKRLLQAKNETYLLPSLNLQIARVYLTAADPNMARRTWSDVMDKMLEFKKDANLKRWKTAIKDKAFNSIRRLKLIETTSDHFFEVLQAGGVSTNVFLRRLHNFALDMDWIVKPVIPKKRWPPVRHKIKRAVTWEEHEKIVSHELNPEKRAFYEFAWHLGASQTDLANLTAENIDWNAKTISFHRQKLIHLDLPPVLISFGPKMENVLRQLPNTGLLFPHLNTLRETDRCDAFRKSCQRVGIKGITLHCYRYSWAQRARQLGYPERHAQTALGHNSKSVHRAYAKGAHVVCPSLEEYESRLIPFPATAKELTPPREGEAPAEP